MYSNAKAEALCRDLADLLTERFLNSTTLNTVTPGFYTDANGAVWPNLTISHNGTVTEGSSVIYIQISNVDMVSKDVFGNQTYSYAPHILQLAYELASTGGPIPAHADLITVEFEAIKTGVRMQLKEIANGTAVTATSANAAAPVADLDQLYWPTKLV